MHHYLVKRIISSEYKDLKTNCWWNKRATYANLHSEKKWLYFLLIALFSRQLFLSKPGLPTTLANNLLEI
jgi:hypothetical protein